AHDNSQGLEELNGEERTAVLAGLNQAQKKSRVQVTDLRERKGKVTFKALSDYLYDHLGAEAPHVIHFDGHGFFGKRCDECRRPYREMSTTFCRNPDCNRPRLPENPQGYLVFESDNTELYSADYVSSDEISRLLKDVSRDQESKYGVRLVVASACKTGMSLGSNSVFNGVAQGLIKQGIPAAIAMQYNVTIEAAKDFSERFYRAIGGGRPLASAVKSGQEAIRKYPKQWYRPILYLRWRDNDFGQLFKGSITTSKNPPIQPNTRNRWIKLLRLRFVMAVAIGVSSTSLIVILRLLGLMQSLELSIYDYLLRLRPPTKPVDERLVVIEATHKDLELQRESEIWSNSPSSILDQGLKELLKTLSREEFRPSIIVLDLYRDFDDPLADTFREVNAHSDLDLYAVCAFPYLVDGEKIEVKPPDGETIPSTHVGFSNFEFDHDDVLRRHLIAMPPSPSQECQSQYSLGFIVARRYLEKEIGQKITDDDIWTSNKDLIINGNLFKRIDTFAFGGYQFLDANGVQFLLNYRTPLKKLSDITEEGISFEAARKGIIDPIYFKDKIVLIGRTDPTTIDKFETPYGEASGVTIHAHMISQLIGTALGEESMLWVWPQLGEVSWIFIWGVAGGFLIYFRSGWLKVFFVVFGISTLYATAVATMLLAGGWIPMLPPMLAWILAGLGVGFIYAKLNLTNKH
ncbi:MAG: CHASE2 domain-containing protein, partial [Leptolyngbya sp. SIO4C1]|nr:CHASE2 domain-containing protein [Leptolyngbya sp. SIO4C1]